MKTAIEEHLGLSRLEPAIRHRLGWLVAIVFGMVIPLAAQTPIDDEAAGASPSSASVVPLETTRAEATQQESDAMEPGLGVGAEQVVSSETSDPSAEPPILKLPPSLPDGRPLRPIALFLSQMDELIPDDYRPVSLGQLNDAISRLTDRATDDKASRLKSAVYWVEVRDGVLISDRSVIDIESDRPTEVRRSLGKVNLAIEPSPIRGFDASLSMLPRLESEADGTLVAVFRGDDTVHSGIDFRWRLNGQLLGSGHEFEMQLPRTPQTRIVLSAPQELELVALDGVLRSRPGPPPDASEFGIDRDLRWYEIDAGGLSRIRIKTRKRLAEAERGSLILRRSLVSYEAELGGITWTARMVVQLGPDRQLPPLEIQGVTATTVKVNAEEVPFTTKLIGNQTRQLQLEVPASLPDPKENIVSVAIEGYATWSAQSGWCDLAKPRWVGDDVVHASSVHEMRLYVHEPLELIAWELPADWKKTRMPAPAIDVTYFSADGPPVVANENLNQTGREEVGDSDRSRAATSRRTLNRDPPKTAWSRARFGRKSVIESGRAALRVEVGSSQLTARAQLELVVDPMRVTPLRLLVEPGWKLETIKFVRSGRMVELSGRNEQRRTVDLWPEAEDAEEGRITLEVVGSRNIPNTAGGLIIPASWFVRIADVRVDLLAAIVPPADLNWSGEAAMQRGRVRLPQLTPEQQLFFGAMSPETLWFEPDTGRTPPVLMQTPSISYNAASVLELRVEDGEIVEEVVVGIESPSQSLKELVVHTGPAEGRPDFAWSISGGEETTAVNLPSSDVAIGSGEEDGVYTIDVSDTTLRGRRLIARRRYAAESELTIQLPSVPGAAAQDSDVLISGELIVKQRPRAVQLVPLSAIQDRSFGSELSQSLDSDRAKSERVFGRGWTRLRYDAVDQPSITFATVEVSPDVTIVWHEKVRVIASSRGTDRIEATYTVSPAAPLRIEYDPELQLASIQRDGVPVDLITLRQRPIVLQPRFKTEEIRVAWNRIQFGSGWLRRCRIPRVRVSGTVLRSEYYLESASDSFAPAALLQRHSSTNNAIQIRPGNGALLLRRNTALALGWLIAMLVFAFGWSIAQRAPSGVVSLIVVATALLVLWWPWRLAVIGWVIVPLISAGMLATSVDWIRKANKRKKRRSRGERDVGTSPSTGDLSADFSIQSVAKIVIYGATLLAATSCDASAQQSPALQSVEREAAVNVLVPVLESGQPSGEMVYVPKTVLEGLFQTGSRNVPQDARFQSATYRVRVNPSIENGDQLIFAGVEAEYQIHVADGDQNTNLIRLPLAASAIQRLELIDDVSRIIPQESDSMGQVIASLPRGNSFRIRATLLPTVSRSGQWTRMFLEIPAVASSRLTVESEQNVDAIRVGGAAGRLLSEEEELLRRWVEEIGPAKSLEIEVRVDEGAGTAETRGLGRRYLIDAGKRQVTIDCEVDPPKTVAAGETFQFVIRDSAVPMVVSSGWHFVGSELYSPTRRLMTVESMRDAPGPIRLLWTQPIQFDANRELVSTPIKIPEVIAAALGDNADAWIGLNFDSALQFAPQDGESREPLIDQFRALWNGYQAPLRRAFVSVGEIPLPVLEVKPSSQPTVDQSHHLHVMPGNLELFYQATLTPSDHTRRLYRLKIPSSLQLTRVSVNGVELSAQPLPSAGSNELLIGDFVGPEQVEVEVVAVRDLGRGAQFSPPRLAILPFSETEDQYRISRDRATELKVVSKSQLEPNSGAGLAMADSLAQGWIPVTTWKNHYDDGSEIGRLPGGKYQIKPQTTRFDCDQLIVLDRVDSAWTMETFIRFGRRIPEYLDLEVPALWCDNLEISPATALSRQQAIDPTRQVIRIRCDQDSLKDRTLSIRGKLSSGETARVTVPSVRTLGFGRRRIHMSLPNRLDNEPVQWRTSAVEGGELPQGWRSKVDSTKRSTYVAANPSWSIDLAPLPEVDAAAIALSFDAQSFPQDDGVLLMCHWDLFPGSLEAIDVRLPTGASCLGAWSAGQAVMPLRPESVNVGEGSIESDSASPADDQNQVTIPLALSRLSQPIELLIRVPSAAAKQARYLPELVDIPVSQNWLTNYVPSESSPVGGRDVTQTGGDRELALARAVVEALDSVEFIVQRPRDEVETWMMLWFARYRMIAESSGHQPLFELRAELKQPDQLLLPIRESADLAEKLSLPDYLQWEELDARMAVYAERYLASAPANSAEDYSRDLFLFGVGGFNGYLPGRVSLVSPSNPPRALQNSMHGEQGLRSLIVTGLTLALIGGILISLRPLQRLALPVVTHPAFWLGLMGIFSFTVAPLPVAASLVLVAIALPVFPSRGKSASGSSR